ncbi:MAG: hypothetical protein BZ138_01285 [Methanosphaera sp. rholeuAM270]|nr:MAG: hypothetical protein BZ138_01285 [Methanosphaera sp. rholeuAM270]
MDSKIILTILVVALIGIVAATYNTQTNDVMNSLANVATEDSNLAESVTDIAEKNLGENSANSVQVDEGIVQPDSSVNNKVSTTKKSSTSNQQPVTTNGSSSTSPSTQSGNQGNSQQSSSQGSSQQSNNQGNAQQSSTQTADTSSQQESSTAQSDNNTVSPKISESEAMSIAKNNLGDGLSSNYQKVSETTINGKPYYEVNLYQDGEIIGYAEIDATNGRITGGATKGEAPSV